MLPLALLSAAAVMLGATSPAHGQQFPGLGSFEGRVGLVFPDDADTGLSLSLDVGLGYLRSPLLRTFAGFNHFRSDVRFVPLGAQAIEGSLSGIGGRAGLRLDAFGAAPIGPYLLAAIILGDVSVDAATDAERRELDRVFGGIQVGGVLGGGATYALDGTQRFLATAEVRRLFSPNTPLWGAEVGIRVVPRGRDAYRPVFRYRDPLWGGEAERARAEAERARLERERAEAEQRRIEQERRLTAAERERLARMTEEERRRAIEEAELARREAELEERRRQEAEVRAAAELEAERLRREAEAAERRAQEAEERLYRSLLDLDRLIANITEIRETERGLVIVLGQGLFGVGQHALSPRARDEVVRIAVVLLQYPEHAIAVEGHTDSTGSAALNQRLSEQRAEAVREALIAQGIDMGRVQTAGYGQDRPIADNATAAGRALNRRVEIVLLGARRPAAAVRE